MFKKTYKEFKEFLLEGNIFNLAVGVIIGGAMTNIVSSLVDNIITPFISIFLPGKTFNSLSFKINGSKFTYGAFITDLISFLITAFVVFILVKSISKVIKPKEEEDEDTQEVELLTEIRDLLKEQK